MARNFFVTVAALLFLGLTSPVVHGQEDLLGEIYGEGVHSYFNKDYTEAHALFTSAIKLGSHDPRCYYFLGMTYEKLERPDESEANFEKGAKIEASGEEQVYAIGRSLERIQGATRLKIERYRRIARLTAQKKAIDLNKTRYGQFQSNETNVLRGSDPGDLPSPTDVPSPTDAPEPIKPLDSPSTPMKSTPMKSTPPKGSDPFGNDNKPKTGTPSDDPFGDDDKPKTDKPADDPFGGLDKPKTDKPKADKPPADEDPFVDPDDPKPAPKKPADDDPFGSADKPAPKKPADDKDDPFADDDEKPAADKDDPFADN